MQNQLVAGQTDYTPQASARLHYLDWLRVLAIFGVFLFHAVHPFDVSPWTIKNAEQSEIVTAFLGLLFPWGMPFFFLIAGAGSWFALRRRTAGQFATERFRRLFIPFLVGCVLLSPIMLYFQWSAILLISFPIIMVIHEFLVRRFNFMRFLFGMKPLRKVLTTQSTEAPGILPSA